MNGRFVLGSSSALAAASSAEAASSAAVTSSSFFVVRAVGSSSNGASDGDDSSAMSKLPVDTMLSSGGSSIIVKSCYNNNLKINKNDDRGCGGGVSGDSGGGSERHVINTSSPIGVHVNFQYRIDNNNNSMVDLDSESSDCEMTAVATSHHVASLFSPDQQQGLVDLNSPEFCDPFLEQFDAASNNSWSCVSPSSLSSSSSSPYASSASSANSPYYNNNNNSFNESVFSYDGSGFVADHHRVMPADDRVFAIKSEKKQVVVDSTTNLNAAAAAIGSFFLDDDDKIELNSVSNESLSEISMFSNLPELQLADLELLENEIPASVMSELKLFTSPPSPPLTPPLTPPHMQPRQPHQQQQQAMIPGGLNNNKINTIFIKQEPKIEPKQEPFEHSEMIVPQTPRRYPNTKDCLHVAEFLCDLLSNPEFCGEKKLIKWEKKEKGLFRILKPKEVANRWARAKSNKDSMNYPNMARGIRFARVKSGDFELVTKEDGVGKKLVYKFSQRFRGRNPWLSSFMHAETKREKVDY